MPTLSHPAALNEFQRFKQASAVLRNTTRATQADWYQSALSLENQLHLRIDGASFLSFYFSTKENAWGTGPTLTEEIARDPAARESWIAGILKQARAAGAKSLGVVLHLADEFATAELRSEFNHHDSLEELQRNAISDPAAILADSSVPVDQASWRFIPYAGNQSHTIGTTISVSRTHHEFLEAFRTAGNTENFPVVTQALSAPLIALKGIGYSVKPTPGKPFVAILQYPWLTAMAFFNSEANLVLIRSLQHRGLRRPTNFRQALLTTNASLEFIEPDLYVAALSHTVDTTLIADLRLTFPNNRVEEIRMPTRQEIPSWAPELLIATAPASTEPQFQSQTFESLREGNWTTQDFLTASSETTEIYPNQGEMKLLRAAKLARYGFFLAAFFTFVWVAFAVIRIISQPQWTFSPSEATAIKQKVAKFTQERGRIAFWDNLLEDRSKAWISMESLVRLIPDHSGLVTKTYGYTAQPIATQGQATVGFIKEWKITGSAKEEALEYLNSLNTREGISAHFDQIAKLTGNEAYRTDLATRSLIINIRTLENSNYKAAANADIQSADDSSYPFTFEMTITQRFESNDPLALNTAKAP